MAVNSFLEAKQPKVGNGGPTGAQAITRGVKRQRSGLNAPTLLLAVIATRPPDLAFVVLCPGHTPVAMELKVTGDLWST